MRRPDALDDCHGPIQGGETAAAGWYFNGLLGHLESIERAAGYIAGFGVKLWVILQDINQLKSLYKDRWETFLGNAGTLTAFGNVDVTTLIKS